MIHTDNAVELMVHTWLGLPTEARGCQGPHRNELECKGTTFGALLGLLEQYGAAKLTGVTRTEIEWYHRVRNELYHAGHGVTADVRHVESYLELACTLFGNLFGVSSPVGERHLCASLVGVFLSEWSALQGTVRAILRPRQAGEYTFFWKRDGLAEINVDAPVIYDHLARFHMQATYAPEGVRSKDIQRNLRLLRDLAALLEDPRGR